MRVTLERIEINNIAKSILDETRSVRNAQEKVLIVMFVRKILIELRLRQTQQELAAISVKLESMQANISKIDTIINRTVCSCLDRAHTVLKIIDSTKLDCEPRLMRSSLLSLTTMTRGRLSMSSRVGVMRRLSGGSHSRYPIAKKQAKPDLHRSSSLSQAHPPSSPKVHRRIRQERASKANMLM